VGVKVGDGVGVGTRVEVLVGIGVREDMGVNVLMGSAVNVGGRILTGCGVLVTVWNTSWLLCETSAFATATDSGVLTKVGSFEQATKVSGTNRNRIMRWIRNLRLRFMTSRVLCLESNYQATQAYFLI
jgi:hypothetical protein